MSITPHHTSPIHPLSKLDLELYAALGADPDLAHRLAQRGLHPETIVSLDHPNPEQYADNGSRALSDVEYLASISRNFPAFDPAVLEHAATRPWRSEDRRCRYTPGPLNRYMAVRDAGISLPALMGAFDTFEAAELDLWAELDETDADKVLHIHENDIHITLSIDGATWNQQTDAARVALALGAEPTPALRILDAWNVATLPSWPQQLEGRIVHAAACDVDIDGAEPDTLTETLERLCDCISRRRFAALAPSLPTWVEAFAAEHPGIAA
jgi:hypothetical protein